MQLGLDAMLADFINFHLLFSLHLYKEVHGDVEGIERGPGEEEDDTDPDQETVCTSSSLQLARLPVVALLVLLVYDTLHTVEIPNFAHLIQNCL